MYVFRGICLVFVIPYYRFYKIRLSFVPIPVFFFHLKVLLSLDSFFNPYLHWFLPLFIWPLHILLLGLTRFVLFVIVLGMIHLNVYQLFIPFFSVFFDCFFKLSHLVTVTSFIIQLFTGEFSRTTLRIKRVYRKPLTGLFSFEDIHFL